jgi:hypothetical protein
MTQKLQANAVYPVVAGGPHSFSPTALFAFSPVKDYP